MTNHELSYQIADLTPILKTFTRRFTNNTEESDDLIQDTIMRALLYTDKFREGTNLKAWLFTIMRNTFINTYRKNRRTKTIHNNTKIIDYLNKKESHTFNLPDTSYEYNEMWMKIENIRKELLIPFRMHTSGYKYDEIADQLHIPVGTVKNRIFNARKEIQKQLCT